MRKAVFIFAVLFAAFLHAGGFEEKAETTRALLLKADADSVLLKQKLETASKRVLTLKNKNGFFNKLMLKRALSDANKLSYRVNYLQAEKLSLVNDLVTYSFMILDANSKEIKECIAAKCGSLESYKAVREKYSGVILEYGALSSGEETEQELLGLKDKDALLDVKDELDKKLVRLEQRIYILQEEKQIMRLLGENEKAAAIDGLIKNMKSSAVKIKEAYRRL